MLSFWETMRRTAEASADKPPWKLAGINLNPAQYETFRHESESAARHSIPEKIINERRTSLIEELSRASREESKRPSRSHAAIRSEHIREGSELTKRDILAFIRNRFVGDVVDVVAAAIERDEHVGTGDG